MQTPHDDQRLSRIGTQWTMVFGARGEADAADELRCRLLLRYRGAVFQYVLGAVRDDDVAEDLCQEFSVRLLRGDFRAAAPERGRFRDYLKASLVNLVNDYWRTRAQRPAALPDQVADPQGENRDDDSSDRFAAIWRAELLERTWQSLLEARPEYHAVLLARVENPEMTSNELAELLSNNEPAAYNAASVRKTLERAHSKFADLLLEEVANSLDGALPERLAEELRELDLLRYCRTALERRGG